MRLLRVAVLWAVAAFVAACQAAPAATVVTPATAANPTYAPVLDHLAIHSAAQANAVAAQALDLAGYPLGSRRLTGRPVAGLPVTGMITGAYTQVTLTRWESVPGTVADAAAWLVGHAAAGTGVVEQPGPDASLTWATARALHALPFGLFAWLAPDGDHVDVTLTANVIWTPAKTPVETIPATVSQAVLDYRAGSNEFGTSSRRTVAGKDLSDLRTVINALPSAVPGVRSCPADNFESATVTMSYGGHRVVMQTLGDTCGDLWVTSDGHRQPDLGGGAYYVLQRLLASASPAPSGRQAARSLLDDVYSRSAAQVRAAALAKLVALPAAARRAGAPAALNPPENVAVSSSSYVWPTSVTGVVGYLESHQPGGFVVAHVGPGYGGVTDVVLQPAHVYPASSLVWLQLRPDGSDTRLRIDAEALWLPPRSPYELIPLGTPSARVTIYADGGAMKRARLTGKGVRAITRALDTSTTERPGLFSCRSSTAPTESLKLEVVYTVGPHHITFYWANGDCPVNAVVDGKRATYLTNPPTALVERLLHWH